MFNQPWPAELLTISTQYNPIKRRAVTTIKLTMIPGEDMAKAMGREMEQALAMVDAGPTSKVVIGLPVTDYNLLMTSADGDEIKIRVMDSVQAVVQGGPEMVVTVKWKHFTEDAVDILEFLHRNMGTVEVQMEDRQASLPGIIDKAMAGIKKAVGPDGSVTMECEGKSVTLEGN